MLRPASGLAVPWHSKQYFSKVEGGVEATDTRLGAGLWADIINAMDASATSSNTQNPERFMDLPALHPSDSGVVRIVLDMVLAP